MSLIAMFALGHDFSLHTHWLQGLVSYTVSWLLVLVLFASKMLMASDLGGQCIFLPTDVHLIRAACKLQVLAPEAFIVLPSSLAGGSLLYSACQLETFIDNSSLAKLSYTNNTPCSEAIQPGSKLSFTSPALDSH